MSACMCAVTIARQFTVTSMYSGSLDNLYLRGSACGLSWNKGMAMQKVNSTSFTIDLQCKDSENYLEMKVLTNDQQWMVGVNHMVSISSS